MSKHTPGPWIATAGGWIDDANGIPVVQYESCGSHAAEWTNPADRELVLAAPELLEALKEVLENCTAGFAPSSRFLVKAHAAIAKAKGE
jgi:hypothetical protein